LPVPTTATATAAAGVSTANRAGQFRTTDATATHVISVQPTW
jgi:hypothetical protein